MFSLWTATRVLEHLSTLGTRDVHATRSEFDMQLDEGISRHGAFDGQVLPPSEKLQVRAKDAMYAALRDVGRAKPPKLEGAVDVTLFITVHGKHDKDLPVAVWRLSTQTGLPQRGGVLGLVKRDCCRWHAVYGWIRCRGRSVGG